MKKLAFVFPGYGCAHAGMGKDVCNYSEECAEIYKKGSEALGIDAAELSIKGQRLPIPKSAFSFRCCMSFAL